MQVVVNRDRQLATIRVKEFGVVEEDQERLVIHELLHLPLDGTREELDFMLTELQNEGLLSSQRAKSYRVRHDRAVEKAVEHLSHVLYDM